MLNIIDISIRALYYSPFVICTPLPSEGLGEAFGRLLLLQTKPYSVRLNLCHHRQQAVATCR